MHRWMEYPRFKIIAEMEGEAIEKIYSIVPTCYDTSVNTLSQRSE